MDIWQSLRLQFPVAENYVYMNHAAVSPLPLTVRQRVGQYLDELTRHGAARYGERIIAVGTAARDRAAELLGTSATQVFFVRSTTQGIGIAATGIPVAAGDNVVLVEGEFPANTRPWMPLARRGVELRFVPQREGRVLLDDLAQAVNSRTRAVSVSFVQFLSGFRIDLGAVAALCRRHEALFVVDAIQGLGAFPVDVEQMGIDFLSADAHKWLLGPEGIGIGYASPRALERIQPALEGWLAVRRPFDVLDLQQPLKSTAARYEEGAYNTMGIHGLLGSLELIRSVGVAAIGKRVLELTDALGDALCAGGWTVRSPRATDAEKSGILLVHRPGVDFAALERALCDRGIIASVRGGALRLSPHAYNNVDDVDRVVAALA